MRITAWAKAKEEAVILHHSSALLNLPVTTLTILALICPILYHVPTYFQTITLPAYYIFTDNISLLFKDRADHVYT